jgi:EAL domain-containing protein (putative c-di-GMP-specific phosphodiesterase class I)
MPWPDFDVLFIGGTTDWKLGPEARLLVAHAKELGKFVHMGRVNSLRRFRYAEAIGCDSADGTYVTYAPDVNLPNILHWVSDVRHSPALFRMI